MSIEFIAPKLSGERFAEHTIPVELLRDWASFEALVIETAKWLYRNEHPGRERVPRGFTRDFALHLSGIRSGSAVPVITRYGHGPGLFPEATRHLEWFDRALARVLDVIDTASRGQPFADLLPPSLLAYFDNFGRSLRDDESINFAQSSGGSAVVYNQNVRKRLVLSTSSEYQIEESLRGFIHELDVKEQKFTFVTIRGQTIPGHYDQEMRSALVSALDHFPTSKVLVHGTVVRDQSDCPRRINDVIYLEELDPLDVPARVEELLQLRDGWMSGESIAPSESVLRRFSAAWQNGWPEDSPLPHLYPMPDGNIQLEWSFINRAVAAEIALQSLHASAIVVDLTTNTHEEASFDLSSETGWLELAGRIALLSRDEKATPT